MAIELKVPSVGESITEVEIGEFLVQVGGEVAVDEPIVTLETDKVTQEILAPVNGKVTKLLKEPGDTAAIGEVIGFMEEGAISAKSTQVAEPAQASPSSSSSQSGHVMPAAQAEAARSGKSTDIKGSGPGGRVLKEDVQKSGNTSTSVSTSGFKAPAAGAREKESVRMTKLRRRIAERLVEAQTNAALLTTFQDCDMSAVIELRKQYQESFVKKHGIKLGFMSFFVKAAIEGLKAFPSVNAQIDGDNIVYHHYYDIGVAVGGGKGLVVPVIRNAETLGFSEVEHTIKDLAVRAQKGTLKVDELQGGTFTISNGGIYGSMLSTPIINPPQSAILGLHNIEERPVAINGQVEVRKMMYLALSYDHRIIDGREAVSCLRQIKHCIENPSRILLEL